MVRLFPIFLISMAALLYQILLMKLMSLVQWSNLVTFILGLAMLGYSAGGVILSIFKEKVERNPSLYRICMATFFSFSGFFSFYFLQQIPLSPHEILWDFRQLLYFSLLFIGLSIPFTAVSSFIGSYYLDKNLKGGKIYFFDLTGASVGSILVIFVLSIWGPKMALTMISSIGFIIASYIALFELRRKFLGIFFIVFFLLANFLWPSEKFKLYLSPHKELNQTLMLPGAKVVKDKDGAISKKTLVKSETIPFREAPGLSLNYQGNLPDQLAIFFDGDSFFTINQIHDVKEIWPYQKYLLEHLPYKLKREVKKVLILGMGGGSNVHQAIAMGANKVDVTANDPDLFSFFTDFPGNLEILLKHPNVKPVVSDGRNFLRSTEDRYDLIQLSLWESQTAHLSGAYTSRPNYLLTIESLQEMIEHLTPNGILFFSRWIHWPPRDSVRLFNTAIESLKNLGVDHPARHMALLRSIQTSLLMVSKSPFDKNELQRVRDFAKVNSFDLVHLPDISEKEINQFNISPEPLFYKITQDLLNEKKLINKYQYKLSPTTDDRPFFNHFLKFGAFVSLYFTKHNLGIPLLDWGHALLWLTTFMAAIIGFIYILIPAFIYYRKGLRKVSSKLALSKQLAYFSSLGLGFMFIEITLINKFILFLGHPIYSVSFVYCSFLFFAGLGSLHSNYWNKCFGGNTHKTQILVVSTMALIAPLLYYFVLPLLFKYFHLDLGFKFILSFLNLAPLAYLMGIPFPLGMDLLKKESPSSVPLALATNGCFSVVGALGGGLLVIYVGLPATLLIGVGLYLFTPLYLIKKVS